MRICHFCFTLDPSRGGVSSGIVTMVKELTRYGISNQIVSAGVANNQLERNSKLESELNLIGVEYRYTVARFRNDYGLGSLRGLNGLLKNLSKPDLIVIHQIYTFSTLLGYLYAKRYRIPYVVMPHGSLTKYHESDSRFIKTLAKWLLISKILREADAIIVTCDSERADLNPPLQAKAYKLIYGAVVNQAVDASVRRQSVGSQNPHIVFSGRFDKKKNLPLVIRAIPFVLDKYPNLILDIAGSGTANEVKMLQRLVTSLKLEDNVQFHGWVDASKMREIFSRAKLLVLPSENENFAIVVAEALSAGVPCVISKFVGTADIVAKHHAGEVIQELTPRSVADGIIKVLQGDEVKYREAAIEAVLESLDWAEIALRWKALVTSLT
ncbi:MAG: glycosyltransferase family 4 protein [Actinobacteria bacterium]|nr:glycosyltransferase family 4 protein [Actinomycetota bacterium]